MEARKDAADAEAAKAEEQRLTYEKEEKQRRKEDSEAHIELFQKREGVASKAEPTSQEGRDAKAAAERDAFQKQRQAEVDAAQFSNQVDGEDAGSEKADEAANVDEAAAAASLLEQAGNEAARRGEGGADAEGPSDRLVRIESRLDKMERLMERMANALDKLV